MFYEYFESRRVIGRIFVSLGEFPNDEEFVEWWDFGIGNDETYLLEKKKNKIVKISKFFVLQD